MKFDIKPLGIKASNLGGLIHMSTVPILVLLAFLNKLFVVVLLVYCEIEALSWVTVFKVGAPVFNASDVGGCAKNSNSECTHFFAPQFLYSAFYAARVYFFSTMSTILDSAGYALLLLSASGDFIPPKSKIARSYERTGLISWCPLFFICSTIVTDHYPCNIFVNTLISLRSLYWGI